ncbi:hypothetical protein NEISICOT_03071 [Neisseria sicca ATCC 29256]|uniref:Uncharacterized protein n=1 Tax=Neisseria sicca ATCC 29256 TaxID=547045 RepID=C6M947_NEISI|nr:hypothetical protein NEISICOT_03071 [Neisseria sicca ATCC 29256]
MFMKGMIRPHLPPENAPLFTDTFSDDLRLNQNAVYLCSLKPLPYAV